MGGLFILNNLGKGAACINILRQTIDTLCCYSIGSCSFYYRNIHLWSEGYNFLDRTFLYVFMKFAFSMGGREKLGPISSPLYIDP